MSPGPSVLSYESAASVTACKRWNRFAPTSTSEGWQTPPGDFEIAA